MATDRQPPVPDYDRPAVHGVDLTGDASTIGNLTTDEASKAKALAGGFGGGSTLIEAYERWKARQEELAKAAPAAEDTEQRALRKSAKHLGKSLLEGMAAPAACAKAHGHYKKHGGRSTYPVWARKVSGG